MNDPKRDPHRRISSLALLGLAALIPHRRGGRPHTTDIETLADEMIRRISAIMRAETKGGIVPRFNQPKTVACVSAEFWVHGDIPLDLKHGLFAREAAYPAMLRFANATRMDDSKKDIRGLSIKVMEVNGPVLWGRPGTQDFILNSHPALFVATPEDFLAFIRARQENQKLRFFLNPADPHLKSLWIAIQASKRHLSPLDIRYWSTVPFRLGEAGGQAVKYAVTPCSGYQTSRAVDAGKNQLRAAIKAHLKQGPARFHFGVQRQADSKTMPIEDASVIWNENASPFQTVATITIQDQAFDSPESLSACERSSFNPWQCLAAHAPLGRMNEVRRRVYEHAAQLRNKE